ncbi:protein tyrosine phosphatase receptor type C-associated protein [Macrotis lagotis]|uniref:protein tyrosine phosphatase receptor type C-associated protein n=1 Tax=Macrotis lagotis TaxID=92651 RepID=UPI003D69BF5F
MALSRLTGLMVLVALPGALGSEENSSQSSVTVCLLVLLLLMLMVGLALAWRHLSRKSGGYYHPTRLGGSLWSQARRLLRASGLTRLLRGSTIKELQDSMERQGEEEDEAEEEEDQEENLEPERKEEQPVQRDEDDVPGSPEDPEAAQGEDSNKQGLKAQLEASDSGSGGRAEALLSDLHAFSGSAAWEDGAGTEVGHGLSITAL